MPSITTQVLHAGLAFQTTISSYISNTSALTFTTDKNVYDTTGTHKM